jgi:hypothetical protein
MTPEGEPGPDILQKYEEGYHHTSSQIEGVMTWEACPHVLHIKTVLCKAMIISPSSQIRRMTWDWMNLDSGGTTALSASVVLIAHPAWANNL